MLELTSSQTALLVLGALAILVFAFRKVIAESTETVTETERGLAYRHGTFVAELGPGRYWTFFGRKIVKVAVNQRMLVIASQEVLSADRLPVKVTGLATYQVVDARKSVEVSEGGHLNAVYFGAQIALRNVLASLPVENLIDTRNELDGQLTEHARAAFTAQGCRLDSLVLRDLVLPAEVRRLATDVTRAKMEAAASLERARGEQATLRLLNNAARLLKGNPELMNLRILQTLASSPGKPAPTVILGNAPGVVPVQAAPEAGGTEAPEDA